MCIASRSPSTCRTAASVSGRLAGLALGASLAWLPAAALADQKVVVGYSVYLNGITIGKGGVAATIDGSRYTIEGTSRLSGIAGALLKFSAAGKADGRFYGNRQSPSSFSATTVAGDKQSTVQMAMSGSSVSALEVKPESPSQGRVPVTRAHMRRVVDPMSMMIQPVAGSGPLDPGNCNKTLPIFNGRERFDIVLSYKRTAVIEADAGNAMSGKAIVCQARYRPIAGHRSGKKEIEYFRDLTSIELWLVEAEGTGVLVPYRVSVPTPIGTGVMQMSAMQVAGAKRTAASQ